MKEQQQKDGTEGSTEMKEQKRKMTDESEPKNRNRDEERDKKERWYGKERQEQK